MKRKCPNTLPIHAKPLEDLMDKVSNQELCEEASLAAGFAYAPYSKFHVGAAVRTKKGLVFTGCNVENASYGLTICAERTALVKAVSEGHRDIEAIAISVKNAASPCGACRQFIAEFGSDIIILLCDANGKLVEETNIATLLPRGFGKRDL